jgi:hypothetical protein
MEARPTMKPFKPIRNKTVGLRALENCQHKHSPLAVEKARAEEDVEWLV